MSLFLLHIGFHEFFHCCARLLIFLVTIKRGVVPIVFLVDVPTTIIGKFQRLCKDDGAPMINQNIGRDLARDTKAIIIMTDIVCIQTIRDSIPIKTDAGKQSRLSADSDLFELLGHLSSPYKKEAGKSVWIALP